jgi:hypothetical protein
VSLAAAGRFGSALTALEPLLRPPPDASAERRLFAALGAATAASVQRQLGRHTVARAYDEQGLALSDGAGRRVRLPPRARRRRGGPGRRRRGGRGAGPRGSPHAQRPDWWRQRVRAGWVRAEVALLTASPRPPQRLPRAPSPLAETSGAPRHVAKGLLFAGGGARGGRPIRRGGDDDARGAGARESLGPFRWSGRRGRCSVPCWPTPTRSRATAASTPRAPPPSSWPTTCPTICAPSGSPGPTWLPCSHLTVRRRAREALTSGSRRADTLL